MRKPLGGLVSVLLILAITTISWKSAKIKQEQQGNQKNGFSARELLQKYISNIYESAHLQQSGLGLDVFDKAVTGFMNLKAGNMVPQTSFILTVVDLAKSSHEKRMWIVDLLDKELILNTYAAHGHGSGDDMATSFSNKIDSHQSSLGFYITKGTYFGKHGLSLKLSGQERGFNDNAEARAVVIHGANYIGDSRLSSPYMGRSFGCPAVPQELSDKVINLLKNGTCLFIYHPTQQYLHGSKILNG